MTIDKATEQGRLNRLPPHDVVGNIVTYLIALTIPIGIGMCLWALELGAIVRIFKEAFNWSYDLFGF